VRLHRSFLTALPASVPTRGSRWIAGLAVATTTPLSPPDSYQVLCPQIPVDNMGTNSHGFVPSVERTWVDTVPQRAYRTEAPA
jgi:hypothetical protein